MTDKIQDSPGNYLAAASLMVGSSICVAFSSLLSKYLTFSLALPMLLFLRFCIPMLLLWWIAFLTEMPKFSKGNWEYFILRAVFVLLAQYALFYYLVHSSVLDATLLFMTSPIFVPIISWAFMGTPLRKSHFISIFIGFLGVLLILKPDNGVLGWYMLAGVGSGILNAFSQVLFHKTSKTSTPQEASIVMYTLGTLLSFVILLFHFQHNIASISALSFSQNQTILLLLLGLSFSGISNQALRGCAYGRVQHAATLTPLMYAAIIFSGLFGWLCFHHVPDMYSIIGGVCVMVSGLIGVRPLRKYLSAKVICLINSKHPVCQKS